MSNESTRVHIAQSTQIVPVRPKQLTAARKASASFLLCLLMIFGAACDIDDNDDNDNHSKGNVSATAKIETQPVDLPPGQTEAVLAWEASLGPVAEYLVFASRNGSTFDFETTASSPSTTIPGRAGDELRIIVMAMSENGSLSETSPPSVPVRFHAAEVPTPVAATTSLSDLSDRAASAIAQVAAQLTLSDTPAAAPVAATPSTEPNTESVTEEVAAATTSAEDGNEATDDATQRVAMLERLLSADARLAPLSPLSPLGRSNAADAWVQSFVDEELAAGVAFVGTGDANGDALRELVWQDASGQLFVSDGETYLNSEVPADTLEEALRLQASERFVAFDDLDGAAGGEWLIEDTRTGQVWIAGANAASTRDGILLDDREGALRLVGLGDFDGDGRGDLLWQSDEADSTLAVGIAENGWLPAEGSEITIPDNRQADRVLTIADLNGDGRDDLLSADEDGRLRLTLFLPVTTPDSPHDTLTPADSFQAFWAGGADTSTAGLVLVGTLDIDQDGEAEIAWIDERSDGHGEEDGLQIWNASEGRESLPEF